MDDKFCELQGAKGSGLQRCILKPDRPLLRRNNRQVIAWWVERKVSKAILWFVKARVKTRWVSAFPKAFDLSYLCFLQTLDLYIKIDVLFVHSHSSTLSDESRTNREILDERISIHLYIRACIFRYHKKRLIAHLKLNDALLNISSDLRVTQIKINY